jgi:hypothetical protein
VISALSFYTESIKKIFIDRGIVSNNFQRYSERLIVEEDKIVSLQNEINSFKTSVKTIYDSINSNINMPYA